MTCNSSEELNAIFEGKTLLCYEVLEQNKSQVLVCQCADACADADADADADQWISKWASA